MADEAREAGQPARENSGGAAAKRPDGMPVGRPFRRGQSGNPRGRPPEVRHVRELARQYTDLAVRTLAELAATGTPDRTRVAAAEALLDRGYGRPTQHIAGDEEGAPIRVELPDEALRAMLLEAAQRLGGRIAGDE